MNTYLIIGTSFFSSLASFLAFFVKIFLNLLLAAISMIYQRNYWNWDCLGSLATHDCDPAFESLQYDAMWANTICTKRYDMGLSIQLPLTMLRP